MHQLMTYLSYQLVLQSPTLTKTSKLGPLVGLTAMKADPMWWPQKEGRLVSHNRVHLHKTSVSFGVPTTSPNKSLVPKLDMPITPLNTNNQTGQSTTKPKPKAKQNSPVSTPPKGELRTRSGRLVKKPPRYQE